ncbi:benzoate/H(+) symporter BenE family transporter [Cellulomonas triticagri]|uniref:Benzoate transporter BenE n=1 Tax=Cellulomonas triticagri TaxID=2483352 RepID=A0A3M2JQH7_9CELL|nr:benzoate/H(+) symporter BenE family transporter [Cellulomonas triticagri]RMI14070.1 benzoate transporter BenE [Cellulomonas triticagri]
MTTPTAGPAAATPPDRGTHVAAGVVTALVGFTSAFAVVLGGLRAVGATPTQAASGLLAVTVAMGAATVLLAWRTRLPITVAWSTPGAALLATTGTAAGGWPEAVGGFLVCGLLLAAVGLWRRLERWVRLIPVPIASAMLAGVLVDLCLQPVLAVVDRPLLVGPVVLVWLVLLRLAPRWATPAAIGLAVALALASPGVRDLAAADLLPSPTWTTPALTWGSVVSVAVPLFVVTMASQNIPGVAVLAGFGFAAPLRPVMLVTGIGTVLATPFGGHAINLAAISAALAAGPEGGPDPRRRWRAAVVAGLGYLVLGAGSAAVAAVALAAPAGLIAAAAGLALVGTLASSLAGAFAPTTHREAAAVTLLVTVSGVSVGGVSAAFWGLLAGVLTHVTLRVTRP